MSDRLSRARATGVLAVLRAPSPELALEASEAICLLYTSPSPRD